MKDGLLLTIMCSNTYIVQTREPAKSGSTAHDGDYSEGPAPIAQLPLALFGLERAQVYW